MTVTDSNSDIEQTSEKGTSFDIPWIVLSALVIAVSAFLRFYWIDLKPLHHDEGVNGHFLIKLFRDGVYQYDPSNYHGPDLYYLALLFSKLFGLHTHSVRWSVALFGVLTVVLVLFLRRWLGRHGTIAAALLLALSPGMVFISRYFIHEMLFVFFSLSFLVAVLYFIERKKAGVFAIIWLALLLMVCFIPSALRLPQLLFSNLTLIWVLSVVIFALEAVLVFLVIRMLLAWDNGRPIYLILGSASLVLLFATKETAFITIGTYVIAVICVMAWRKIATLVSLDEKRRTLLWIFQLGIPIAAAGLIWYFFEDLSTGYLNLKNFFEFASSGDQTNIFHTVIFLALTSALAWVIHLSYLQFGSGEAPDTEKLAQPSFKGFRGAINTRLDLILIIAACSAVFIYVGVLFFSSFFTYPRGVLGAFEAYAIWTRTGSTDHTQNGTFAYVRWLAETEAPILILGTLGSLIAWLRSRNKFAFFTGLWAFGLLAAYTIIPYKTPWLALSFILPLCLVGGYGIGQLVDSRDLVQRAVGIMLAMVSVSILAFQAYDLNFVRYDDDRMPYVYAHTKRGFDEMMDRVKRIAEASKKGKNAEIDVVSRDYWPMPWYLKDFPHTVYYGQLTDSSKAEIVIAGANEQAELAKRYGRTHRIVGTYPLRPGVDLILLVRNDVRAVE